jgi:hypothetical protein
MLSVTTPRHEIYNNFDNEDNENNENKKEKNIRNSIIMIFLSVISFFVGYLTMKLIKGDLKEIQDLNLLDVFLLWFMGCILLIFLACLCRMGYSILHYIQNKFNNSEEHPHS